MLNIPESVKELFKLDNIDKNFRVHFPNGEHADLTNNDIDSESVSFTESLSSRDHLQFGLCESPSITFRTIGVGNIRTYEIECSIEIDVSSLAEEPEGTQRTDDVPFPFYRIPYGVFYVDQCNREWGSDVRSVTAYGQQAYLNWTMNNTEKEKQEWAISKNSAYKVDIDLYAYSQIKGNYNYLVHKGLEEITQIDTSSIKLSKRVDNPQVPAIYWTYNIKMECLVIDCAEYDDKTAFLVLYDTRNEKTEEIQARNLVDLGLETYKLSVGNNPYFKGDVSKPTLYLESTELNNKKYIPEQGAGIYYNRIDDFYATSYGSGVVNRKKLYLPLKLTVYKTQNDEYIQEKLGEVDFSSRNYRVYLVPPKYNIELSVPRYATNKKIYDGTTKSVYPVIKENILENTADFIPAIMELLGVIGHFDRAGGFDMIKLDNTTNRPGTDKPSPGRKPEGTAYNIDRRLITKLMLRDERSLPYDRVSMTYTNTSGDDQYIYANVVDTTAEDYDPQKYQSYTMGRNWIIQNKQLTPTQAANIVAEVAENIKDVEYTPLQCTMKGLPFLESGDRITITADGESFDTYILAHTLRGVKDITDTITSY